MEREEEPKWVNVDHALPPEEPGAFYAMRYQMIDPMDEEAYTEHDVWDRHFARRRRTDPGILWVEWAELAPRMVRDLPHYSPEDILAAFEAGAYSVEGEEDGSFHDNADQVWHPDHPRNNQWVEMPWTSGVPEDGTYVVDTEGTCYFVDPEGVAASPTGDLQWKYLDVRTPEVLRCGRGNGSET